MTRTQLNLLSLLLFFILSFSLNGQNDNSTIKASQGKFLGKSSKLSSWKYKNKDYTATAEKRKAWKDAINGIPNFKDNKNPPRNFGSHILPKNGDPIVQPTNKSFVDEITVLQDYDAIAYSETDVGVPDCNGDIGLNYYIMTTNSFVAGTILHIYDKITGELVENTTMTPLWTELGATGAGDPVVFFDRFENRWVLTEFTYNNSMLMAVSDTDDPLGSYNVYEFFAPSFPDYPKFSSWSDAYYITTNEYQGSNPVYAIDKQAMIDGAASATFIAFDKMVKYGDQDFFHVSTPTEFSGQMFPPETTPFTAFRIYDDEWDDAGADRIEYINIVPNFENPGDSEVSELIELPTEPFESNLCGFGLFDCLEQSDGSLLSAIHTVIMNKIQYRNFGDYESILLNFSVDVTGNNNAGVRWMELRKTNEIDWYIHQESTFAPDDGISRFMGTLTQDSKGNILLAYAMVGPETDPSVGVTGRRSGDVEGMMTFTEKILVEGQKPSVTSRWGDYFSITVDPQNDSHFWLTSEYMPEGPPNELDWMTRLTEMIIRRDSIDAAVTAFINPVSGDDLTTTEAITIRVSNPGYKQISDVPYGVMLDGTIIEEGVVSGVMEPLESVEITLSNTADLSEFGSYKFKAYTYMEGDENIANDTFRSTVTMIAMFDLAAQEATDNAGFTCKEDVTINARFENNGTNEITTFDAELYLNGSLALTQTFAETILMNQSVDVTFDPINLVSGINTITYKVISINSFADQVNDNDEKSLEVDFLEDAINTHLSFTTDFYGGEVSWNITDAAGVVVYSGSGYVGTYVSVEQDFCFQEGCYTFNLIDGFGDGWGSFNEDTHLELVQDDGLKVVFLDNFNFGNSWSMDFCLPETCELDVEIEYEHATGTGINDAAIYINYPNGNEITLYSIDGGENWQSSPLFYNLVEGQYDIVVLDQLGCTFEETVNILLDIIPINDDILFQINPNPSFGMMNILLDGYVGEQTLDVIIIDQNGKKIGKHTINKFSDGYRAVVLVPNLPAGTYFASISNSEIHVLKQFVKM